MSRRRRYASSAPRTLPRKKKGANVRLDRFEIRARAQTLLLRNPDLSLRELALAVGQPYIVVRDALHGEGVCGTGLSQSRFPLHEEQPEFATAAVFEDDDEAAAG